MNVMTEWLERWFDEVEPREFYRGIFPAGSFQKRGEYRESGSDEWGYNGILVSVTKRKKADGTPVVKRYTVTDDLEVIDQAGQTDDFCLMSPISYVGRERTAANARYFYAFAVDLDRLRIKDGRPLGLINLWERHVELLGRIPKPTYIVSSGTGLHLYYVLTEPVPLYRESARLLQDIKRDLTTIIWDDTIVDIASVQDIQQEGIYQGFRVPGTITKRGDRARAFWTGDKIELAELAEFTSFFRDDRARNEKKIVNIKKKPLTLAKAKELYPEWYERRIEREEPRAVWHTSRRVYEWWKVQIRRGAVVGHRYYCIMMLAIYARKCSMYDPKHNPDPVTREELERDAFGLLDFMESKTDSEDNHFTEGDILDALEAYDDKWITYPRRSVEYKSGIRIDANRRNGRKQAEHVKLMRAVQSVDYPDGSWRDRNGRKSKGEIVQEWKRLHPDGRKADCIRETGLSKPTVYKWW